MQKSDPFSVWIVGWVDGVGVLIQKLRNSLRVTTNSIHHPFLSVEDLTCLTFQLSDFRAPDQTCHLNPMIIGQVGALLSFPQQK